MSGAFSELQRFLAELRRRKVYRVAIVYVAAAFVGLEALDLLVPATTLPDWAPRLFVALAVLGFPVALVLAWAFELTPAGVRRTESPETPAAEAEAGAAMDGSKANWVAVLTGLGVLVAAVVAGWYVVGGGRRPEIAEGSVAVLPFEVTGSGVQEWHDGMVTVLSTGLDGVAGLRAIADRTVFAAWGKGGPADGGAGSERALEVARRVGARYAVIGSAVALGPEIRFAAGVHDTGSGLRLGTVEVRGPPDSVPSLADDLTRRLLGVLLEGSSEQVASLDAVTRSTRSLPALKSYLEGERRFRAGDFQTASEHYEAALEEDSTFALAAARLALSYWWIPSELELSAWRQAYELSGRLPRRERRLVQALYLGRVQNRTAAAADSLRQMTQSYPDDPTVWSSFGEILFHGAVPRGWPEADGAFRRAVELDPGNSSHYPHYVHLGLAVHHDSALAAERIARVPEDEWREVYGIFADLIFARLENHRDALARLDSVPLDRVMWLGPLAALAHPTDGHVRDAFRNRLLARDDIEPDYYGRIVLRWNVSDSFIRGQIEKALAALQHPQLSPEGRAWPLCQGMIAGAPIPDSILREHLEPSAVAGGLNLPGLWLCSGLYLIEQGRDRELERVITRLREAAAERNWAEETWVDELNGYRAWKRGELARAAELASRSNEMGVQGALWRGDLYRELGRLPEAEGWYLAAWPLPIAHERLGQVYEQLGQPDEAAAAYDRFIEAWKDANPRYRTAFIERAAGRRSSAASMDAERRPTAAVPIEAKPGDPGSYR